MHLIPLGVVRKLFGLTFKVGKIKKGRRLKSARIEVDKLSNYLRVAKSPCEFNRRPRPIEEKSYKDLKASGS